MTVAGDARPREAGLKKRAATRLGGDPDRVIEAFRKARPEATPWICDPDCHRSSPGHARRSSQSVRRFRRLRRRFSIASTGRRPKAEGT